MCFRDVLFFLIRQLQCPQTGCFPNILGYVNA